MKNTIKHLEMIQSIINRLESTSFLLKGWAFTLVSGILALLNEVGATRLLLFSFFP
jgi:hypothetical protein